MTGAGQAQERRRAGTASRKIGASAAAPPGQEWSPGQHHARSAGLGTDPRELPGPLSTYLPSLARSTSCVWCPRGVIRSPR